MSIEIKEIPLDRRSLRPFVEFGIDLYRGNPYYVPPLIFDEINTLLPEKNPAFDICKAKCWMAFRDGKPVGRICGIINSLVNERSGRRDMRFGFCDFIDDPEVVDALFSTAEEWGRSEGMDSIIGPMGFTDMDHEAMLTDGFDELGTMATIYNYPYYPEQMARMGFEKDASWVEYRIVVPTDVPDQLKRVGEIVRRKFKLRTIKYKSSKKIKADYGVALFELINQAYDQLYGYSPLTPRQIQYYIDMYLPMLRLDNVCVIVDESDTLVGIGIAMPSMTKALQKARGRVFPFGWYYLLKALYGQNDTVDLLLVAVRPDYQGKGVNSLLFTDLLPVFINSGYRWAETNLELADNESVQQQWKFFERRLHRKRSVFRRQIATKAGGR